MKPLSSGSVRTLSGDVRVPGDKSVSHRALILGSLAVGRSTVRGLLEAADVMRTAAAMRAFGAEVERADGGAWEIHGRGVGGLAEPAQVLDMGNSGTAARLLIGAAATHPFATFFTGDESLAERPMARVAAPLSRMGAQIRGRAGCRLPLMVAGAESPVPISYRLPVASAQVKSAVLLAGLNAPGETTVIEPQPTRDHTELMLRHFGADIRVAAQNDGSRVVTLAGQPEITGREVAVPGDVSSAAFPMVAALIVPDSEVTLRGVGVNPLRSGLMETLREMGADIAVTAVRDEAGEPVADITCRASALSGVEVPAERAPTMIDEYPILAVAAAWAKGATVMRGLGELRVKESDRLMAIARGLGACGVETEIDADTLTVRGAGGPPAGDAAVETRLDHRIAMAFLVLGLAARRPVRIDDGGAIETSFPGFVDFMNGLGAAIAGA